MRGRQVRTPLAIKTKTKGRSYAVEDTQRLVTAEIEMLKVVLYWWRGAGAGATVRERDEIFTALSGRMSGSRQLVVDFHFLMGWSLISRIIVLRA
jgi:hypothetical protein